MIPKGFIGSVYNTILYFHSLLFSFLWANFSSGLFFSYRKALKLASYNGQLTTMPIKPLGIPLCNTYIYSHCVLLPNMIDKKGVQFKVSLMKELSI